mmetsp:Transcript_19543/g.49333  ORF Transcript_19543/g.49333 Transcript_19543/m.49333 type:complete len:627 (-) Transcript_19543:303-2183(-)
MRVVLPHSVQPLELGPGCLVARVPEKGDPLVVRAGSEVAAGGVEGEAGELLLLHHLLPRLRVNVDQDLPARGVGDAPDADGAVVARRGADVRAGAHRHVEHKRGVPRQPHLALPIRRIPQPHSAVAVPSDGLAVAGPDSHAVGGAQRVVGVLVAPPHWANDAVGFTLQLPDAQGAVLAGRHNGAFITARQHGDRLDKASVACHGAHGGAGVDVAHHDVALLVAAHGEVAKRGEGNRVDVAVRGLHPTQHGVVVDVPHPEAVVQAACHQQLRVAGAVGAAHVAKRNRQHLALVAEKRQLHAEVVGNAALGAPHKHALVRRQRQQLRGLQVRNRGHLAGAQVSGGVDLAGGHHGSQHGGDGGGGGDGGAAAPAGAAVGEGARCVHLPHCEVAARRRGQQARCAHKAQRGDRVGVRQVHARRQQPRAGQVQHPHADLAMLADRSRAGAGDALGGGDRLRAACVAQRHRGAAHAHARHRRRVCADVHRPLAPRTRRRLHLPHAEVAGVLQPRLLLVHDWHPHFAGHQQQAAVVRDVKALRYVHTPGVAVPALLRAGAQHAAEARAEAAAAVGRRGVPVAGLLRRLYLLHAPPQRGQRPRQERVLADGRVAAPATRACGWPLRRPTDTAAQ